MAQLLLVDDLEENRASLASELEGRLPEGDVVQCFDGNYTLGADETYEDCIERWLNETQTVDDMLLVACDKELGRFQNFRGLSANVVSKVARNLGLPFCQYARNQGRSQQAISRYRALSRWDCDDIALERDSVEGWAHEIAETFEGFKAIRAAYEAKPELSKMKPAEALAEIAGRPESATRIALYGAGDQSILTEVFAFKGNDESRGLDKRMPRILGDWLRLSILRFPGVLVNETAAASFLNISPDDFHKDNVKRHFEAAQYSGPFFGLGKWWWREELDAMVLDGDAGDGRELVTKKGEDAEPCLDKDGDKTGYYCMITESPVARSKSVGDINWFPAGADLARIESGAYDELTSLVQV